MRKKYRELLERNEKKKRKTADKTFCYYGDVLERKIL